VWLIPCCGGTIIFYNKYRQYVEKLNGTHRAYNLLTGGGRDYILTSIEDIE
jgi:hypothetical protein